LEKFFYRRPHSREYEFTVPSNNRSNITMTAPTPRTTTIIPSGNNVDSQAYAIDAELMNKGRRFALTKRRVRFSFGFGNKAALEAGECGQSCRGEEHQVVLIWSLTSGKQRVLADGIEVHFGRYFTDRMDCQWTMKNGHVIRVVGKRGLTGDLKKFDLIIDGLSYWKMPQIYQLGGLREVKPLRRRTLTPPSDVTSTSSSLSGSENDVQTPVPSRPKTYQRAVSAPIPSPTTVRCAMDDVPSKRMPKIPLNQDLESLSERSSIESRSRLPSDFSIQSEQPTMFRSTSTSDLSVQSAYASYTPLSHYNQLRNWPSPPAPSSSHPIYSIAG
jgi:hypothetical protein